MFFAYEESQHTYCFDAYIVVVSCEGIQIVWSCIVYKFVIVEVILRQSMTLLHAPLQAKTCTKPK